MTTISDALDMSWMLSPAPRPKDYDWPDSMTEAGVPKGTDPDSYPRLSHRLFSLCVPLALPVEVMEKHYASDLFQESIALKAHIKRVDAEAHWFQKQALDLSCKSSEELKWFSTWHKIKQEELEALKLKRDGVERSVRSVRAKDKARLYQ